MNRLRRAARLFRAGGVVPRPCGLLASWGGSTGHYRRSYGAQKRQSLTRKGGPIVRDLAQPAAVGAVLALEYQPALPALRIHQMSPRRRSVHVPHAPPNPILVGKFDQPHRQAPPLESCRGLRLRRLAPATRVRAKSVPTVACVTPAG